MPNFVGQARGATSPEQPKGCSGMQFCPELCKPTRGNIQGQALRLTAMLQARMKPLASIASGDERIVNGRAAASGEKQMDSS